jgi:hypothetical protein
MARPNNVDELTAGLRPFPYDHWKLSATTKGAGTYYDFFVNSGFPGGLAVAPALSGAACNLLTQGALPIGNTPAGKETWLTGVSGVCSGNNGLILYDRLVHYGSAVGNITTVQNLGAVPLPRYTSGIGVVAFLEWFGSSTGTAQNLNVTYINENNVSRTVVVTVPAAPAVGQLVPIQLVTGDKGIKAIISVQFIASTGQAGNFGPVLMKRFPTLGAFANIGFNLDWLDLGLPKIEDDACLGVMAVCSATTSGLLDLQFSFSDV